MIAAVPETTLHPRADFDPDCDPRQGLPAFSFCAHAETVLLAASLFWACTANRPFLAAVFDQRPLESPGGFAFVLALLVMLAALHFLLLALVTGRRWLKPLLTLLLLATALATHYMRELGIYLDPTMLRNVLRTNPAEARELLGWNLLPHLLLYAVLPAALLWRVRIVPRPFARATAVRGASVALALVALVGPLMVFFQPIAAMTRNHRELRYLITPANYLWGSGAVAAQAMRGDARPRQPIGLDAQPGPRAAARTKPFVLVLVVGETARAANWGLSGYERQTTPELARLSIVNWPYATACGTNTETSLPCMFAPVGRRSYDEARIRGSESLLHVAARAGVGVLWRDNQAGCKGVCDGLPTEDVATLNPAGLCRDGHCLDEGLLAGLDERLAVLGDTRGPRPRNGALAPTRLIVLHMLGNHGPAYWRRYPAAFARFKPACESDDLARCTREQIVAAYDNALLYTDHVLASLVAKLQAAEGRIDSAMLYVSDHGESLGERGLFLHGMPYAIAPNVQKQVPMALWFSAGTAAATGTDLACLRAKATQPAAHDHLFHTVLGLLDLRTALHEPAWDLGAPCRVSAP